MGRNTPLGHIHENSLMKEPEYVDVYFQNDIQPIINTKLEYLRDKKYFRPVLPEIKTDTIFD